MWRKKGAAGHCDRRVVDAPPSGKRKAEEDAHLRQWPPARGDPPPCGAVGLFRNRWPPSGLRIGSHSVAKFFTEPKGRGSNPDQKKRPEDQPRFGHLDVFEEGERRSPGCPSGQSSQARPTPTIPRWGGIQASSFLDLIHRFRKNPWNIYPSFLRFFTHA